MNLYAAVLIGLLAVHANTASAEWHGEPVADYIAFLTSQGARIIYSDDLVSDAVLMLAEPTGDSPQEALRAALKPHGLTLSIGPRDNWLVVRDPDAEFVVAVVVKDKETGDGVIGAIVVIDDKDIGTTDIKGRYEFRGSGSVAHNLGIRSASFAPSAPVNFTPSPGERSVLRIELQPLPQSLEEIVVNSSVYNFRYRQTGPHTFLDRDFSSELPDVGDEAIRGIDRLPGVANGGVSTRSHIRGGARNEQLVILDGLRLYEPYHLKDFHSISTIVSQGAIDGIDFYTAGYGAQHGDRMSGVIDMQLCDIPDSMQTELGLSLYQTSLLSTGRFADGGRGDWLVSGRRSNLHVVSRALRTDYGSPKFEDALLHGGWQWSDRTYIAVNFLYSRDRLELSQGDVTESAIARYQNNVGWLKVENQWSGNLSSATIVSAAEISNQRSGQVDLPDTASGWVDDNRNYSILAIEQDWRLVSNDRLSFTAGFDFRLLDARYEYDSSLAIQAPFDQIFDNAALLERSIRVAPEGEQYAFYGAARVRIGNNLVADLGLRFDRQTYSVAKTNEQRSPRLNFLYDLGDRTELRAGFGRFYQAQEINELQVDAGLTEFFRPQHADHIVASVLHHFENNIDLRIEAYRKNYKSTMPRFENVFDPLVLIPELQIDRVRIDAGSAFSEGLEMTVSGGNDKGGTQWWAGYTWSSTKDSVAGNEIRRGWDQSHAFKAGINREQGRWHLSAAASWHSGWPRTEMRIDSVINPDGSTSQVAVVTPRNSLDYDSFHTLDVRASRRFQLSRGELTAFIEVTNLLNRDNPCCVEYRGQTEVDGTTTLHAEQDDWLPLIPSIGIIWKF